MISMTPRPPNAGRWCRWAAWARPRISPARRSSWPPMTPAISPAPAWWWMAASWCNNGRRPWTRSRSAGFRRSDADLDANLAKPGRETEPRAVAGAIHALQYRDVTRYIRYRSAAGIAYGILDGETVREIRGGLLDGHAETGATHQLSGLKLLCPCQPGKIMAVGLNYQSHLGSRPQPAHPEMFYKPVTALQNPEDPIIIPPDAADVHSEGELVVVVGKQVKNA